MQKIKELLCKIFGHKWELRNTSNWPNEEWVCKRCGATTVIKRR